ncbi:MAG TPA: InlB B-repeat-containing protein, partial [Bacilli bacterium]|nr:InlB B-repeat-containing protein [Bacilli bacterium]
MKKLKFVLFIFVLLTSFLLIGDFFKTQISAVEMSDKSFTVNVTTILEDGNSVSSTIPNQAFGKKDLTIDLTTPIGQGYQFVFYIVNGKVYRNQNQEFMVTSNLEVVAVLKPTGQNVAVFVDANGALVGFDYVVGTGVPTAPSTASLSKPGYAIDGDQPWSIPVAAISSDTIYVANYVKQSADEVTISVTNGTGGGTFSYNSVVTVTTTDEGFGYWKDDKNQIVSYQRDYSFTAIKNRSLTAVAAAEAAVPVVSLVDASGIRTGHNSYLGQYELPDGYQLLEAGFLFSDVYVTNLTLDTPNVQIVQSTVVFSQTNEFLRSATASNTRLVRAYATVQQGENPSVTYYSGIQTPATNSGLMIWEVYGAGGNTGAYYDRDYVVLYNGASSAINLTGYTIQYASSDKLNYNVKCELEGTIAAGSYFVVAESTKGSNGTHLPNYVNQYSTLGFGANNGKIALTNDNVAIIQESLLTNVVDLVGYGSTANFEPNPTGALSVTTSAKRNSTTDTNNNSVDFTVGALDESSLGYLPAGTFYTISFNSNGGSAVESITYVPVGSTITLPINPTKTGYAFAGWYTDEGLSTAFDASTPITSDLTLYAKWTPLPQYTVSFDLNGGNSSAIPSQTVYQGEKLTEPTPAPTHETKIFVGWFTQAEGGTQWNFSTDTVSQTATLFAQWSDTAPTPTATIDTAGKYTNGIGDGLIPAERLSITKNNEKTVNVYFYKKSSTTDTIFNNSAWEIRLYKDKLSNKDGGELKIEVVGCLITKITVNTTTTYSYTINGGDDINVKNKVVTFPSG